MNERQRSPERVYVDERERVYVDEREHACGKGVREEVQERSGAMSWTETRALTVRELG